MKKILLTGDTPTGKLHLGHYVGSIENRLKLQDEYNCYFLIANRHAFTTQADKPETIHQNVVEMMIDYLAVGIDPKKSTIFLESEIPAIAELSCYLSMLVPFNRVLRNPTIRDELRDKSLEENYSFGFLLYPIMQMADIMTFHANLVPVGEDQLPLIELTREVARRFNQFYCGVDPHTKDEDYVKAGGIFPIPEGKVGRVQRLVGTGGPTESGQLVKMSKSLGNSILLSDDADTIATKIKNMYTDPKRLRATDPGQIENNPLWIFHETFNPDKEWVREAEERYRQGKIGDVECKKRLTEVLITLIQPIYERRKQYEIDIPGVMQILKEGTLQANEVAEKTLNQVKNAVKQIFF